MPFREPKRMFCVLFQQCNLCVMGNCLTCLSVRAYARVKILAHRGLLFRSWNDKMPGVEFITMNERTARDLSVTLTITYERNNCNVIPVPRNLFCVTDINPHSPSAAWNAISQSVHSTMTVQEPVGRYTCCSWLSVLCMITIISILASTQPLQICRIRNCSPNRCKHSASHVNMSISLGRSSFIVLQCRVAK